MIGAPPVADATLRHVHKLRLAASSTMAERRALRVLEESLRLFTLPGESTGRVFYFRRLQLPQLCPDEDPNVYAVLVEQKCRERAQSAIHFSDPGAAYADCVFALSSIEPWQELARRIVFSQQHEGWFWSAALPKAAQIAMPRSPLEVVLCVANQYGDRGVLEFFHGVEPEVLRAIFGKLEVAHLEQGKLPAFCKPLSSSFESAPKPQVGRKLLDRLPASWRQLAAESAARWMIEGSSSDPRVRWIIAAAWLLTEPERAMDTRFPEKVESMLQALIHDQPQPNGRRKGDEAKPSAAYGTGNIQPTNLAPEQSLTPDGLTEHLSFASPFISRPEEPLSLPVTAARPLHQTMARETHSESKHRNPVRKVFEETSIPTDSAGFFYCLGLLDRMGIGETLSSHPELIDMNFVRHLLSGLAVAAGTPEEDSVLRQELWLHAQPLNPVGENLSFSSSLLPVDWRDQHSRLPLWPFNRLVRAWLLALRRRIWRATRLNLGTMVQRPGEFTATRTHLEITMPQNSLEASIRKAGFDLNPGWLPWLGRVVTFHYSCPVLEVIPMGGIPRRAPVSAMLPRMRSATAEDEKSGR
ncbi:MAG TPA: hypothetical protein VF493_19850 [Terriglobales bacterium]